MNAVLLAAGRGSRMGRLTANTPKPLLPLCGRPIVEHILTGLHAAGVDRAVIVTGYLGEQIEARLGDGGSLGMSIAYRRQEQPTGTAKALLLARDLLDGQPFVLSWGDIVIDPVEYAALVRRFAETRCDAMITVNPTDDPWRGAAVTVDDAWRVRSLVEKPPRGTAQTGWNNAGIFAFTDLIFTYAERLQPSARGEYELPQAIATMIADGRSVHAHPLSGFWSDLGTPEDLTAAERVLSVDPR
jgi:NDP-sugar pyrophosphorylase family protein